VLVGLVGQADEHLAPLEPPATDAGDLLEGDVLRGPRAPVEVRRGFGMKRRDWFSPDAVSVEAVQLPGRERTVRGLDALRGKSQFFLANNEVHKAEIFGPYPHDDRFAVRFVFELTFKPTGERRTMDEIGLFTVVDGKIAREEFFYHFG
jgi:hypothetical protein